MKTKIIDPILERLVIPNGVFYPDQCSIMLADLALLYPGSVLDIGTGSGYVAIRLAQNGRQVTATEISKKALMCAEKNASLFDLDLITFVQSDLYKALSNRIFDIILYNPPKESNETEYSRRVKTFVQTHLPADIVENISSLFFFINRSARRKSLVGFIEQSKKHLSIDGKILINLLASDANYICSVRRDLCLVSKPLWTNEKRTILLLSYS